MMGLEYIVASLPRNHIGKLYTSRDLDLETARFFADAYDAPLFRIAGVIALLSQMSSDGAFGEGDRKHVDQEKTALFWRIIGGEVPSDTKTSTGSAWPAAFIETLPAQASRVLDDCHLRAYKKAWDQSNRFFAPDVAASDIQSLFTSFRAMAESPLYREELRLLLLHNSDGVIALQKRVYSIFIKLGLLERAMWKRSELFIVRIFTVEEFERQRSKPAQDWASRQLEHPIPLTKLCIKALCENLALPSVGGVDDTTRAQIKAVSEEA
jgi:hypothetical protein